MATLRKDLSYRDGRRPTGIRRGTIEDDVLRRDFTINGMLYDPFQHKVIDLVKGASDLRKKIIRTIGNPNKRFQEDHLRMLRAIRFSVELDFKIEKNTWKALSRLSRKIRLISAERIRDELLKISKSPEPDRGLRLLDESGILKMILPEVVKLKGVTQSKKYHPEGDVFKHTCLVMRALKNPEPALAMGALFHDIEKPSTRFRDGRGIHFYGHEVKGAQTALKIMKRLRFSRGDQDKVDYLVRNHLRWYVAPEMRATRLRQHMTHPYFALAMELLRADHEGSNGDISAYCFIMTQYRRFKRQKPPTRPFLMGKDLLKMGLKEGPIIGEILKEVEERRLDEGFKSSEEAKKWVKKAYNRYF